MNIKNVEQFKKELLTALEEVFEITELKRVEFQETGSCLNNPISVKSYRKLKDEQKGIYLLIDDSGDFTIYETDLSSKGYKLIDYSFARLYKTKLSYMLEIVNKLTREVDF